MTKILCTATLALLIFTSCDRKDPVITIANPTAGQHMIDTIIGSIEVEFDIGVTDNKELHEVIVVLKNVTDNETVLTRTTHVDDENYAFDSTITFTKMHTDYSVEITAEDHKDNAATSTVDFHIHKM